MPLKGSVSENLTQPSAAPVALQDHSIPAQGGLGSGSSPPTPWEATGAGAGSATVSAPQALAVPPAQNRSLMSRVGMEDDGFGDMDGDLGFGSFPIVKLDKDKFEVQGESLDDFECILLQSKDKWIIKASKASEAPFFYTYDMITDVSGNSVEQKKREWEAAGYPRTEFEEKRYKEVLAKMLSGKFSGKLVLLSVPPASINRLGGYRAELSVSHRYLNRVITKCSKGDKIKISNNISFYPWTFSYVRDASSEDLPSVGM